MPTDEIEVNVNDNQNQDKNDTPVTFVETDGETMVHVGEEKKGDAGRNSADDPERFRRAEETQLRLAADVADLRARLAGGGGGSPSPAPQGDPWKSQEDAIAEQERALSISWEAHKAARALTPELAKEYDQKSRELNQRRINIATQRALQESLPTLLQATQQQRFRSEYGDVQSNPAANRWARGHYDMLVAQGAPESEDTIRQAMNAARNQFRIGGARMQPTDQDRSQYTGFSGTRRASPEPRNNVVKMGKAEKGMAMAMYGDRFNGDERKAYAQWAKGPGVRAQKAAQKVRRQGY